MPVSNFYEAVTVCCKEYVKLWVIAGPIAFNILCNYPSLISLLSILEMWSLRRQELRRRNRAGIFVPKEHIMLLSEARFKTSRTRKGSVFSPNRATILAAISARRASGALICFLCRIRFNQPRSPWLEHKT